MEILILFKSQKWGNELMGMASWKLFPLSWRPDTNIIFLEKLPKMAAFKVMSFYFTGH